MRVRIPIGGRESPHNSRRGRESAVNCFVEKSKTGDFVRLRRAFGLDKIATVGTGAIRGLYFANDKIYIVSGSEAYAAEFVTGEALVASKIGDMNRTTGIVSIFSVGTDTPEIVFVDNGEGFSYKNSDGTFVQITDVSFTPDRIVTSLNQRFYLNKPDSNEFFCSDVLDGRNYDALFFASAESQPDNLVGVFAYKTQLLLIGEKSCERWQSIVDPGTRFPVRIIPGANIERGCLSPYSIVQWEDVVIWLADDKTVRVASSGSFDRISDLSFEEEAQGYSDFREAIGFFADSPTHKIYYLTFPTSGVTWGFDFSTGFWHKREAYHGGRWRVNCMTSARGEVLCGDYDNGNIYLLKESEYKDYDERIRMQFTTPAFYAANDLYIDELQVIADMGISDLGNVDGDGQVYPEDLQTTFLLEYSKDGGSTWIQRGNLKLGTTGDTNNVTIARLFGRVKRHSEFVLRFTSDSPAETNIYQLWADVVGGIGDGGQETPNTL